MTFLITAFFALAGYLFLMLGSGPVLGLWSTAELVAGFCTAVLVGWAASRVFFYVDAQTMAKVVSPARWLTWIAYLCGPFLVALVVANLDVAGRVITGKINPGIVRIKTGMKTNAGVMMLGNSITLTPGTLTVDIDDGSNDMYIHWIDVKTTTPTDRDICGSFADWVRRIVE